MRPVEQAAQNYPDVLMSVMFYRRDLRVSLLSIYDVLELFPHLACHVSDVMTYQIEQLVGTHVKNMHDLPVPSIYTWSLFKCGASWRVRVDLPIFKSGQYTLLYQFRN